MTAFNEVLTTEQEAEQAIVTAKEEVAKATLAARAESKTRLVEATKNLQESEVAILAKKQIEIDGLVEKIHTTVKSRVDSVKQQFASHKVELKETLTKNF